MQVETKDWLDLCEATPGAFLFWDLETSGLGADYGDISVFSGKYFGKKPFSYTSENYTSEQAFLDNVVTELETAKMWSTFNGKMFDVPFVNTRRLVNGAPPLSKKLHLDLYLTIKGKIRVGGKSLGNLGRFLRLGEKKMDNLHQDTWRLKDFDALRKRGESDVKITEEMYRHIKPFILQVTR